MARPFQVKLCAFSPNAPDKAFGDIMRMNSIDELVKTSDIISVRAPGRPEYHRLFNKETFT